MSQTNSGKKTKDMAVLTVLSALLAGQQITFPEGDVVRLVESESGAYVTASRAYRWSLKQEDREEIWVQYPISLQGFLNSVMKFTRDEIYIIAANNALNKL